MAYPWAEFQTAVGEAVTTAWPEISHLWSRREANEISWEASQDVDPLPVAVFEVGKPRPTDDWGAVNDAFLVDYMAHYIATEELEEVGMMERLEALRDVVKRTLFTSVGATLLSSDVDWSEQAEANRIFMGRNIPYIGGTARFEFVVGTTYF